ncbi:hypothetical protein SGRI78S_01633 [Streptomyces griseus subsp. griseus]
MVGEEHDPVGARGVVGDLGDQGEGPVEAYEDLLRVAAVGPRVVGDLVVGHEVGVDGGASGEHVAEDGGGDHVALHDGRERADEGVEPAALDPRCDLPGAGPARLADLPEDLGGVGEGGAGGVRGIGEVGEVSGAGAAALAAPGGHREDQGELSGSAAEEVAPARAVDGEQTAVAGVLDGPALHLQGAGGTAGDHDGAGLLLVPAERGHVVVAAVQDGQLAGAGLTGPVGAPGGEPVSGGVGEPAGDGGHEAVGRGLDQDVVAHSVELEEDGAGRSVAAGFGRSRGSAAPAAPVGEPGQPSAVGLVVADREGGGGGGGDGGHHCGDDDRRLRVGVAAPVRDEAQRYQQQGAVEEEDQGAQDERGHDEQGADEDGPDQGRQEAEGARAPGGGEGGPGDGVAVVGLELEVGQGSGQHEHGEGGHRPDRGHPHQGPARRAPLPVTHAGPPRASPPGAPVVRSLTFSFSQRRRRSSTAAGASGARRDGTGGA